MLMQFCHRRPKPKPTNRPFPDLNSLRSPTEKPDYLSVRENDAGWRNCKNGNFGGRGCRTGRERRVAGFLVWTGKVLRPLVTYGFCAGQNSTNVAGRLASEAHDFTRPCSVHARTGHEWLLAR